ncbi:AAA family ATPase [Microbacterium oxydans]|uniref:nucleotide-binding protein n=1 Tax=Microbacterium sp. B19(2022) TaxID=2914045 RepID=UPI00142FB5A1|nr:AAA family ATPase [Microbacterium sp. B19(2022)]
MTPKNITDPEESPLGVLDEAASLDTAGIGILGGTAQVSVTLPKDEDDDLTDDGVVEGEVVGDLVIDPPVAVQSEVEPASTAKPLASGAPAAEVTAARTERPDAAKKPKKQKAAAKTPTLTPVPAPKKVEDLGRPARAADETAVEEPGVDEAELEPEPEPEAEVVEPSVVHAAAIDETPVASPPLVHPRSENIIDAVVVDEPDTTALVDTPDDDGEQSQEAATAERFLARAKADVAPAPAASAPAASAPAASVPARASVEKENRSVSTPDEKKSVASQPVRPAPRVDVTLTSKRLDDLGDASRESADLLTADRLLDPHRLAKPEPEGAWSHFLYAVSGRRINIGDGRRARERKALSARIAAPLAGGARFVPVLSRKGGVGKTTITALLGMALADAREDRVIAVDANPDRGTLAERIVRPHHSKSVRDLVRIHDDVKGYHDISAIVARDATRLDVLASDSDPRIAEAFSDSDYRDVAGVAAHYYSLVLTDTGTGIVHSVMSATLDLADQIVIVSGLSVDEARLASETLTWLETNGYAEQARDAIVVLNQSTPGTPLVRLNELQAHFATRARSVVRVPYDPQIAGGGTIVFANLLPETRIAARELAALLVEGLRAKAA